MESSKAKLDGFQFYVPSRNADGEEVAVVYHDADGRVVGTRDVAKPLLSVYMDDDPDPANGDDVWAAYSLDDGATWDKTNLSAAAWRSSFAIDGEAYEGMVSKPALTLKGDRALVAWTSTYCDGGSPGYENAPPPDTYGVAGPQRSVDYALQGFPEVGEVPYKCLWAVRGKVQRTGDDAGAITWYQAERITSGTRYAMQIAINSAPNAGFILSWGEDPEGLNPGGGLGPGEGWTGASPNPGTDVWYSWLPMTSFDGTVSSDDPERPRPAANFSVPVPISNNGRLSQADPPPTVGATRPALGISPYSFDKPGGGTGTSAWVAYGYEETKGGAGEGEGHGKKVVHHSFDFKTPDVYQAGSVISPLSQCARRVRYITQPVAQLGPSRTIGLLIYRMGVDPQSGPADFLAHRFVVPSGSVATDDPFRVENLTGPVNVSATTHLKRIADPVTGQPRTTRWIQTEANLQDTTSSSPLESARGHRGMIKGDFLALGYLWTPNWGLYMQGRDVENYFVRRSFDGGATFTSAPAEQYDGDGVASCRYFTDPLTGKLLQPACQDVGPGEFEPAQNLSRLDGLDETAIEPRLPGMPGTIPGSPYSEDVQDTSVLWQAWGTGAPQSGESGEDDPDIPVPDEGQGKTPLDLYFTFSQDYGDTYVENETIADGPSAQAETQMRFSPDGSHMYVVWNDYGPGELDVFFRRITPDLFPDNTTEGELRFAAPTFKTKEGNVLRVKVERAVGRRGEVGVSYETLPGTAVAGRDYEPASGELTFGHGDVGAKVILIPTIENTVDEKNVRFRIRLSNATGGAWIGTPHDISVTIIDDDDTVAPRSRATSPAITKKSRIPVRYTTYDKDSKIDRVILFVMRPGSGSYRRAAADRKVDGRFGYRTGGLNGKYRFYTIAVDRRGNVEGAPNRADTATTLDTVAPRIRYPAVYPNPFRPATDGSMRMRFVLLDHATSRFIIRKGDDIVRRFPRQAGGPGIISRLWHGRVHGGGFASQGEYTVVMKAWDRAGNITSRRFALTVR